MAATIVVEGRRLARSGKAFSGNGEAGELNLWRPPALNTFPGTSDRGCVSGGFCAVLRMERRQIAFTSRVASVCGPRERPIRKKIIGHGMSVFRKSFTRGSVFLRLLRAFLLFHQPARQHGRGIFLDPKIEQRAYLLAEIGGMVETREFIALQRVSRSGKKKLPRRLSFVVVHAGLLESCAHTLTLRKKQSRITIG